MKALRISGKGPEGLTIADVADPVPGPFEVLVRVRAAGVNRADLLQTLGLYPAPRGVAADIPGLEYAGEVAAVGAHVTRFLVGHRVMGLLGGGAFAELVTAHEREVVRMPGGMEYADAAALPEALMTAYDALVLQGGMVPGETVLIHAVASGVGTAASQLVAALGGTVIGTSRSAEKLRRIEGLGVRHALHVKTDPPELAAPVLVHTGGSGVELALDLVGGSYLGPTLAACAPRARVLLVGLLAGREATLPLGLILQKRLRIIGTVLRSRPIEEKIACAQAFERGVLPLVEHGKIRPVVDAVLPFSQAGRALERLGANDSVGKIVLAW